MKRLFCVLLCIAMLGTLAACGMEGDIEPSSEAFGEIGSSDGTNGLDSGDITGTEYTDDTADSADEPVGGLTPQFSISGQHTAYLSENGDLYVWGNNTQYQLGYGGTKEKPNPYCIMTSVKKVSAMPFITMALKTNGDLYVMGSNSNGSAGFGDKANVSVPQVLLSDVTDFAQTGNGGAAITSNGDLYVWGCDGFLAEPVKVLGKADRVFSGKHRLAVITEDGTLYAWESMGSELATDVSEIAMENYVITDSVSDVVLFGKYLAAIKTDGSLFVDGRFLYCEETTSRVILDKVAEVSLYHDALLALTEDGTVYAFGGYGHDKYETEPKVVYEGAKAICAGDEFAMLIDESGDLYGWGSNSSGQLGTDAADEIETPTFIMGDIVSVHIPPEDEVVAAISSDGSLYTWGTGYTGKLGYVPENGSSYSCEPVKVLDNVAQLWFGAYPYGGSHAAAICEDGRLYLWGSNTQGEVGNGTDEKQVIPCEIILSE